MIFQPEDPQLIRELLIGMEFTIAFLCVEFFIIFIYQYREEKQDEAEISREQDPDAYRYFQENRRLKIFWAIFFLILGFAYVTFLIADFYTTTEINRQHWLFLGYLAFPLAISFLCRNFKYKKLQIFFLIYVLIGALLAIIVSFQIVKFYFSLVWPISGLVIVNYIISIRKKLHGAEFQSQALFFILTGLIFMAFGFFFTTDIAYSFFGIYSRLAGDGVQFISVIGLSGAIYLLPPLSEYDWRGKIKQIFVITTSGITIFDKNFEQPANTADTQADFAGSAIIALKMLIETMIKEGKNLESINKTYATISLIYGKNIIGVAVTEKKSPIINAKVKYFIKNFEKTFGKSLENFSGSMDYFQNADKILKKYFPE